MSDAGDVAPNLEGTVTGGTVIVGGQEVATELEEVVDLAVAGKEPLDVPPRLKSLHPPFSSSRRLVRDLGAVVEVAALAVLDPRQVLPLGRALTEAVEFATAALHLLKSDITENVGTRVDSRSLALAWSRTRGACSSTSQPWSAERGDQQGGNECNGSSTATSSS